MNYSFYFGVIGSQLFLVLAIAAFVGVGVSLLMHAQKRDQNSPNTPQKFSFLFLLKDNWRSIVVTFILILATIRFAPLFFPEQFQVEALQTPLGTDKWILAAFGMGIGFNQLVQVWKDKTTWLRPNRNGNGG